MSIISQYNRFKRTVKAAYELGKAGNMYMIFDQIAVSVYEGSEHNTCYTVNTDLLPDDLKNGDDEDLAPLILAYHHKEIDKPNWIMEDI